MGVCGQGGGAPQSLNRDRIESGQRAARASLVSRQMARRYCSRQFVQMSSARDVT